MQCPVCRQRAARRACPALAREICPVCCGTKRLVEIACPPDCGYLASAQAHPAAIVRKQQQRDVELLTSLTDGLSGPQKEMAWGVLGFVSRFAADPLLRLQDEDVADMAGALASTLQTAARGVIYEHRPRSLVAQRLLTDLKAFLEQSGRQGERGFDQNMAAVLERLAATFRDGRSITGDADRSACLATVGRVLRAAESAARSEGGTQRIEPPRPSLIRP